MHVRLRDQSEQLATGTYADSERRGFVRLVPPRWRKVIVGTFRACPECGALVDGRHDKHRHQGWHDQINELFGALFGDRDDDEGGPRWPRDR